MKYRPEIDGLRAIAVLAVILYHAEFALGGFSLFPGGFIGVDVFFVISGYLITGILLRELQANKFSFRNFYERRARRILPPLYLVMFASVPFAWVDMFPKQLKDYAQSIVASIFFSSNILFWQEDSYNAEPSALKPFLHTWSLSLEEQYYLFFPVLLLLSWKFFRSNIRNMLFALFFASLALAEWQSRTDASSSFFLLPARGWELIAGGLLAEFERRIGRPSSSRLQAFIPPMGILLILVAVISFHDEMIHPSVLTLAPVLGVMSLIWFCGGSDPVTKILSSRLLVGIGLISYSLYLWHQPIFAFARIRNVGAISDFSKIILICISIVLAWISWRFVEAPFRNKKVISKPALWSSTILATSILVSLGLAGHLYDGYPKRLPTILLKSHKRGKVYHKGRACSGAPVEKSCRMGSENSSVTWFLLGDSHMGTLTERFWGSIKDRGERVVIFAKGGAPYAPKMEVVAIKEGVGKEVRKDSLLLNQARRRDLLQAKPSVVVLNERLPVYLSGKRFDNEEGGVEIAKSLYLRPIGRETSEPMRKQIVKNLVIESTRELLDHGHKVVIIYPVPEVGWHVPQTIHKFIKANGLAKGKAWLKNDGITTSHEVFKRRSALAYDVYDSIGEHPNLLRIYPEEIFCGISGSDRCITHTEGEVYYADDDHLSNSGAGLVVKMVMNKVGARWGI